VVAFFSPFAEALQRLVRARLVRGIRPLDGPKKLGRGVDTIARGVIVGIERPVGRLLVGGDGVPKLPCQREEGIAAAGEVCGHNGPLCP
jgi:hypothetical protein